MTLDGRVLDTFTPPSNNSPGLFAYGFKFSRSVAFTALGGYWFHRATGAPVTVTAYLYDANTQAVLASSAAVSTSGWVDQTWNKVPYGAPYGASSGIDYVMAVEANGTTSYDGGAVLPASEYNFTLAEGRYLSGGGFPTTTWTGLHGVGLNFADVVTAGATPSPLVVSYAVQRSTSW